MVDPVKGLLAAALAIAFIGLASTIWRGRIPGTPKIGYISLTVVLILLLAGFAYLKALGLGSLLTLSLLSERFIVGRMRVRKIATDYFKSSV